MISTRGRNYLPFQELTVEAPVPESYELITSAIGVALAVYLLGQLDAFASAFQGFGGSNFLLWAPPLGRAWQRNMFFSVDFR